VGLKTKNVTVTVHLDLSSTPPFTLETSLPKTNKGNLKFKGGKKDGFLINFELDDPDNVYTWGSDPAQALWSTSQATCPTEAGQWDQFTSQGITDSGMTLQVLNRNETSQDFGYTLRITRDNGANYVALDPIGTNQNSNLKSGVGTGTAAATILGAAAGFAVAQFALPAATTVSAVTGALIGAVIGFGLYYLSQSFGG
jgi:hypothetical protein